MKDMLLSGYTDLFTDDELRVAMVTLLVCVLRDLVASFGLDPNSDIGRGVGVSLATLLAGPLEGASTETIAIAVDLIADYDLKIVAGGVATALKVTGRV